MSVNSFKDKAIDAVRAATEADNAGEYEKAYNLYIKGLECFSYHCKYDKNPESRRQIQGKMGEYMQRAEYLKTVIARDTKPDADGSAGSTQTAVNQQKKPPGASDEAERDKLKGQLNSAIVTEKPNVKWDDVSGLEGAKDALKEAVILPVKFPQFFTGKRKPWSGILLYGPPGTGKSYLAKAVATEADSTFLAVSSSDLVSKWMGESEKLVSELFKTARENAPSIVFIDEVDSLCSVRGDNESEAARRIKTEFLVQMQGVNSSDARVLVLGATNLPYNLDQAIRRRFDKRIYIALPDAAARAKMFKIHLGDTPNNLREADFRELGERTEGFSGSDVSVIVKDTLMQPIRKVQDAMHFRPTRGPAGEEGYWEPCAPSARGAIERDLQWFAVNECADKVVVPPITMDDFQQTLHRARPTVAEADLDVFTRFTAEFGEEGI